MLYFDRVDISEEINVNKTSKSKESDICPYWRYFLDNGFKFQADVCSGCHDVLLTSMNLGADYRCVISRISKS